MQQSNVFRRAIPIGAALLTCSIVSRGLVDDSDHLSTESEQVETTFFQPPDPTPSAPVPELLVDPPTRQEGPAAPSNNSPPIQPEEEASVEVVSTLLVDQWLAEMKVETMTFDEALGHWPIAKEDDLCLRVLDSNGTAVGRGRFCGHESWSEERQKVAYEILLRHLERGWLDRRFAAEMIREDRCIEGPGQRSAIEAVDSRGSDWRLRRDAIGGRWVAIDYAPILDPLSELAAQQDGLRDEYRALAPKDGQGPQSISSSYVFDPP